jgi:hypothetical protein
VLTENSGTVLRDDVVAGWLDSIYEGATAEAWEHTYEGAYREFEAACLATLRAFDTDSRLEELFYQAFDSIDVLPACLSEEYMRLINEGQPIEASQLGVSMSWDQFQRQRRGGRAHKPLRQGHPWVVDAPYDSETGLRTELRD